MEITAYQTGFACLLENQQKKKMLQVFLAENINHSEDYTFKELNDSKSQKYQLKNIIISNMELENVKEAIIVTDEFSGITHALSSAKKAEIVNISNETLEEVCFAKLVHLQVKLNIAGVRAFSKTMNGILAVTYNHFYYYISLNREVKPEKLLMSPDEILSKIVQGSMVIESLNKEINISQEYLEFKEIMQTSNLLDQVELEAKNRYISIKSKIKHVLRKDFWKIRETMSINKKHCVMYHDIETDLYEGMVVKIKSKFIKKNKVELSLLGDFGPEFDILLIPIGNLEGESNNDEEELTKTLSEIAKIRNPYVK
ncbi:hypothetical protein RUM43_014477 [Polyplax serrata]|uniref:Uncharacterized protein n=1 Tax=Polyplax serrata TaxID=468196 RepID=A0AAN8NIQ0_POLSC